MTIQRLVTYCATLFLVLLASLTDATAQNESRSLTTLYNFQGAYGDGGGPIAGVLIGSGGLLFGITTNGGASNDGTVFSLTPPSSTGGKWTESVLHSFVAGPTDGALPSSLVAGSGGVLYGSTEGGGDDAAVGCRGVFGCGVIFSLTPPPGGPTASAAAWKETVLYSFTGGSDGSFPTGLAVRGGAGLFGTTGNLGSVGDGSVFSLIPTASSPGKWTETVLDSFQGSNGADPVAGVTIGKDGALYGTTSIGGERGLGTVFKMAPPDSAGGAWTEAILYSFKGSDGAHPKAGVAIGEDGALYGTSSRGGDSGYGTAFSLNPPASSGGAWEMRVLHSFTGVDGAAPQAGVAIGGDGALYGTTVSGGTANLGTVFRLML